MINDFDSNDLTHLRDSGYVMKLLLIIKSIIIKDISLFLKRKNERKQSHVRPGYFLRKRSICRHQALIPTQKDRMMKPHISDVSVETIIPFILFLSLYFYLLLFFLSSAIFTSLIHFAHK